MVLLFAAILIIGAVPPVSEAPDDPCVCAQARIANGWCDTHDVGYVAGLPIRSANLFEALDAHGHDFDPASMECESCQVAIKSDGLCPECQWGFVDGQLFFSKLTYLIALGKAKDIATISCATCRRNAGRWLAGVPSRRVSPSTAAPCSREFAMLLPSPT